MNKIRLQSSVSAAVAHVVCFVQTLLTTSLRLVTEYKDGTKKKVKMPKNQNSLLQALDNPLIHLTKTFIVFKG